MKVIAQKEFWSFLVEIQPEIHWRSGSDPAPLVSVFSAACYYLHPEYKYDELESFFWIILDALELPESEIKKLLNDPIFKQQLIDNYTRVVQSKIKIAPDQLSP